MKDSKCIKINGSCINNNRKKEISKNNPFNRDMKNKLY